MDNVRTHTAGDHVSQLQLNSSGETSASETNSPATSGCAELDAALPPPGDRLPSPAPSTSWRPSLANAISAATTTCLPPDIDIVIEGTRAARARYHDAIDGGSSPESDYQSYQLQPLAEMEVIGACRRGRRRGRRNRTATERQSEIAQRRLSKNARERQRVENVKSEYAKLQRLLGLEHLDEGTNERRRHCKLRTLTAAIGRIRNLMSELNQRCGDTGPSQRHHDSLPGRPAPPQLPDHGGFQPMPMSCVDCELQLAECAPQSHHHSHPPHHHSHHSHHHLTPTDLHTVGETLQSPVELCDPNLPQIYCPNPQHPSSPFSVNLPSNQPSCSPSYPFPPVQTLELTLSPEPHELSSYHPNFPPMTNFLCPPVVSRPPTNPNFFPYSPALPNRPPTYPQNYQGIGQPVSCVDPWFSVLPPFSSLAPATFDSLPSLPQ